MVDFKYSCFLCCSIPSFGVSAVPAKDSTSAIAFIRYRNRHHMKNHIRYKCNINNTSVIIFLIGGWLNKNFSVGTLLGRSEFLWCWLLFFIHFLFFILLLFFIHFQATLPCHHHSTLVSQARGGLHRLWALPWLPLLFHLGRALWFWVGIFYPQAFFCLALPPRNFPALIEASPLGVESSSLGFEGLHADPQSTDLAHLFVWFTAIDNFHTQKNSFLNFTKYYHKLLAVKI